MRACWGGWCWSVETFGYVNVVLEAVNVEAPEESGDQVDDGAANEVPKPRLQGVG